MSKRELDAFPIDVLVDSTKSHEAVFVDPDQGIFTHGPIAEAFEDVDARYAADREGRIRFMHAGTRRFRTSGTFGIPAPVDVAYMSGADDAASDELLLVTSPLNDGRPKSSAEAMIRFINTENPSSLQIARTQPNSWGPAVKLDVGFQLLKAMGRPVPVAQLYSRLRPRVMSFDARRRLWDGDYTAAYGEAGLETIAYVNEERRKEGKKQVTKVHLFGAGIAQRAAATARYLQEHEDETGVEVASVVLQNLALHRGIKGTVLDHATQAAINEASQVAIPGSHVRIDEPLERQDTDQRGSDTLQMYGRQFWAGKDLLATTIPFATKYEPTVNDIKYLADHDIPLRLISGLNVGMAIHTLHLIPLGDPHIKLSTIVGIEGQKVSMAINESSSVTGLDMSLGIGDYDQAREQRRGR